MRPERLIFHAATVIIAIAAGARFRDGDAIAGLFLFAVLVYLLVTDRPDPPEPPRPPAATV